MSSVHLRGDVRHLHTSQLLPSLHCMYNCQLCWLQCESTGSTQCAHMQSPFPLVTRPVMSDEVSCPSTVLLQLFPRISCQPTKSHRHQHPIILLLSLASGLDLLSTQAVASGPCRSATELQEPQRPAHRGRRQPHQPRHNRVCSSLC